MSSSRRECPSRPGCWGVDGSSNGRDADGCTLGYCCVTPPRLGGNDARVVLVNDKLTAILPAHISSSGMQPSWYLRVNVHQGDAGPNIACSLHDKADPVPTSQAMLAFCPLHPAVPPACGDNVSFDIDYSWGTIACYLDGGSRSDSASVTAPVECLTCPTTQPTNDAQEPNLPVGTECSFGTSKCQVVWKSTYTPLPVWKCG